jgi:hypothetical protein
MKFCYGSSEIRIRNTAAETLDSTFLITSFLINPLQPQAVSALPCFYPAGERRICCLHPPPRIDLEKGKALKNMLHGRHYSRVNLPWNSPWLPSDSQPTSQRLRVEEGRLRAGEGSGLVNPPLGLTLVTI